MEKLSGKWRFHVSYDEQSITCMYNLHGAVEPKFDDKSNYRSNMAEEASLFNSVPFHARGSIVDGKK